MQASLEVNDRLLKTAEAEYDNILNARKLKQVSPSALQPSLSLHACAPALLRQAPTNKGEGKGRSAQQPHQQPHQQHQQPSAHKHSPAKQWGGKRPHTNSSHWGGNKWSNWGGSKKVPAHTSPPHLRYCALLNVTGPYPVRRQQQHPISLEGVSKDTSTR